MNTFTPTPIQPPATAADDPRVGHLIKRNAEGASGARVVLLGFPSDEGVRRNGGRPGAAEAPDAIRQALYKLTPDARASHAFIELLEHTADLGNLAMPGEMEENQQRLGEALAPFLRAGAVPIILGGGHETSFGHFLGYVEAGQPVEILNWDAHADVRPLRDGRGHSGSPFRQALEHPAWRCDGYTVAGLLPHSTARAHLAYLDEKGAAYVWRSDLSAQRVRTLYGRRRGATLVTFDLDAVDQAWAPGVSAPAVGGMDPGLWLAAAYEAGRSPDVASIDLVEYNPAFDEDGRTARLAALTIWEILRGLAERRPRALDAV